MAEDEVLSALSIIYGFFLLFLSTLLSGLDWIPGALSDIGQGLTYSVIWTATISCVLVGLEIWKRLHKKGLSIVGHLAMIPLNIILPFFYFRVIGDFVLSSEFEELRMAGLGWWLLLVGVSIVIALNERSIGERLGIYETE